MGRFGSILGSAVGGILLGMGWGFAGIVSAQAILAEIAAFAMLASWAGGKRSQGDPSGHCVNMLAMPIVSTNAKVRSFPTAERGPLIWMGDPDHAYESLVPDATWLASGECKTVSGSFHIVSDRVAIHVNLLDQSHFPFLHPRQHRPPPSRPDPG